MEEKVLCTISEVITRHEADAITSHHANTLAHITHSLARMHTRRYFVLKTGRLEYYTDDPHTNALSTLQGLSVCPFLE